MASKYSLVFALFSLVCVLGIGGSFIKPNSIPRVGRSNEADGPYDQNTMGYVIKTIPNKNIPRMGRRNFDSGNKYDIPKLYQVPSEVVGYQDEDIYYASQYENMKR